jgi:hypothetical protein
VRNPVADNPSKATDFCIIVLVRSKIWPKIDRPCIQAAFSMKRSPGCGVLEQQPIFTKSPHWNWCEPISPSGYSA